MKILILPILLLITAVASHAAAAAKDDGKLRIVVFGSRDDSYRNVTVWGQPGTSTLIGWRASSMGWNWSSVSRFFVSKRMMP
tara:strand:+ start:142 stop:387 length:246 start_codon:yes stop_codon:yes gene_type:complete